MRMREVVDFQQRLRILKSSEKIEDLQDLVEKATERRGKREYRG